MILTDFAAGLREIFLLRAARAKVAAYGDERLARIREEKRIARARLAASRRMANAHVAVETLEVAWVHAQRAAHAAAGTDPPVDDASFVSPAAPTTFAHAEALRDELESRTRTLLVRTESRTDTELRGLRAGRFAAIAVFVFMVARALALHYGVHNVARGKPVTVSSVGQSRNPSGVVDGRTRGTFGVHTNEGPHPFVMIDLGHTYRVRSIRVYNRGDGWFDEVLPLTIEVSPDGIFFHEVARRTTHFDVWTIELGAEPARYVRATKDSGYIALNEIEVYSRE